MRKITIIGHFGGGETFLDGQTIKTRTLYDELKKTGKFKLLAVDTYYKSHNPIKLAFDLVRGLLASKHIFILVAENGMRFFFPILYFCAKVFKKRIYQSVIGASLDRRVKKYKNFKKYLNSFEVNWCETAGLVERLRALGVDNAELLYNFKRLDAVKENEMLFDFKEPYRLCTFSRVMREKGIEDAICAVDTINKKCGKQVFALDIYGQVDAEQTEWFDLCQKQFPDGVRYCGEVASSESVDILKDYFALLFPTRYLTEGVPGTIIDAYAAGLPVIASRWENFDNIIDENTGIGYEFNNVEALVEVLDAIKREPSMIINKKTCCLEKYRLFSPDVVLEEMLKKIGE